MPLAPPQLWLWGQAEPEKPTQLFYVVPEELPGRERRGPDLLEIETGPALSWDWVVQDRPTGAGQEGGGSSSRCWALGTLALIFSLPWGD